MVLPVPPGWSSSGLLRSVHGNIENLAILPKLMCFKAFP